MPAELREQLHDLEDWAKTNGKDARTDTIAFWSLKAPAILASAGAGILAHFDLTMVGLISGAVASACIVIDGVHPRGMLRNMHLRAFHDIRNLAAGMVTRWRSRDINTNADEAARQIVREAEPERKRIAAYIRNAETALIPKS